MRIGFPVVIMAVMALSACATQINTDYIARMDGFIGKHEKALIDEMGVPDKTYEIDRGPKMVSYVTKHDRAVGGGGFGMSTCMGRYGNFGYGGCLDTLPRRIYTEQCEIIFTIEKSRVKSWQQRGNSCPRIQ